ncbi:hypothetical protein K0A97_01225 [Patescibacteria group bacterium]|nr:hypothetical protein [Patescibacteria group bacterium]
MVEKETIFSSTIKYDGLFSFKDFYKFCYEWLNQDKGFEQLIEEKYEEKIKDNEKELLIQWVGLRNITDYFRFEIKVKFEIKRLQEVEIMQGQAKIRMNKGSLKVSIKGDLVRDYQGKFEMSAFNKFLRGIYEKWVITSRVEEYDNKLAELCDEFLGQAKAYLDLEGKK